MSFSPDGLRALSGSTHGTVCLWCLETGALLRALTGHGNRVTSTNFSSDGKRIVTAAHDGTAKLWVSESGVCLRTLYKARAQDRSSILAAAFFSEGGVTFVSKSYREATAVVWRTESESGALRSARLRHSSWGYVTAASFSTDGETLLTGSSDGAAELWCTKTAACLCVMPWNGDERSRACPIMRSVALSPDGDRALVGMANGIVRVWSMSVAGEEEEKQSLCVLTLECGSSTEATAHEA